MLAPAQVGDKSSLVPYTRAVCTLLCDFWYFSGLPQAVTVQSGATYRSGQASRAPLGYYKI
jgi:hypothetical protein